MVLIQALLGLSGKINKLLSSAIASNLSPLYELQSKELHEKDKKLGAPGYQSLRWNCQTSLFPYTTQYLGHCTNIN